MVRHLLKEVEEIQNGGWDQKLLSPYMLVEASPNDPLQARYAHPASGAIQSIPPQGSAPSGTTDSSASGPAGMYSADPARRRPKATSANSSSAPPESEPSIAQTASQLAEQASSDLDKAMAESLPAGGDSLDSASKNGEKAASPLPNIPEESEAGDKNGRKGSTAEGSEEGKDKAKNTGRRSRPPAGTAEASASAAAGTPKATRPAPPTERRSSRQTRQSITSMSEVAPAPSGNGKAAGDASGGTFGEPETTTSLEPLTSTNLTAEPEESSLSGAPLSTSSSSSGTKKAKDSRKGRDGASPERGSTAEQPDEPSTANAGTPAAGGRRSNRASTRRSSAPPPKEGALNKRKRTTTPQAGDASGTGKRIKTEEEADSSVSTPGASSLERHVWQKRDADHASVNSCLPRSLLPACWHLAPEHEHTPDPSVIRRFRNSAPHLIAQLQSSVHATYFKEPVRDGEAAGYKEIIKRPMDLKTLGQNVKNGRCASSVEFTRDLLLIVVNAVMYNGADHHVAVEALAMWQEAKQ